MQPNIKNQNQNQNLHKLTPYQTDQLAFKYLKYLPDQKNKKKLLIHINIFEYLISITKFI